MINNRIMNCICECLKTPVKFGWNAHQVDGGFALTDIDFGGKYEIHPYDGKY